MRGRCVAALRLAGWLVTMLSGAIGCVSGMVAPSAVAPRPVRAFAVPQLAHAPGSVITTVISADHTVAVTASSRELFVWDAVHGKQVRHETGPLKFALSSDGRTLVLAGDRVRICALASDRCAGVDLPGDAPENGWSFDAVALTPSERHAWVHNDMLSDDGPSFVMGVAEPTEVRRVDGLVIAVSDEPDGHVAAFVIDRSAGDTLVVYRHQWRSRSTGPGNTIRLAELPRMRIDAAAISRDGRHLLVASDNGAWLVDAMRTGRARRLTDKPVKAVRFSDSSPVVTLVWTGRVVTYDERDQVVGSAEVRPDPEPGLELVTAHPRIATISSPDGQKLVLSIDGRLWLWDMTDLRGAVPVPLAEAAGVDPATVARFAGDTELVLGSDSLRSWSVASDASTTFPESDREEHADVIAVSADHRAVFRSGGSGGRVGAIWTIQGVARPVVLMIPVFPDGAPAEQVVDAAFSPSGLRLITGSKNGAARVWDVSSGRQVARLDHPAGLSRVSFASDDRVVTVDDADEERGDRSLPWPRLWQVADDRPPRVERVLGQTLHAISPGGTRMLVDAWVLDGGRRSWQVPVAPGKVAAISDDGERVAIVDDALDRLRVFARSGELDSIPLDGASLVDVAFQGASLLRATDSEGVVHLWRACDRGCRDRTPREICRIIATEAGWIAIDAFGRYDTSSFDVLGKLAWVMSDRPLEALPADLFIRDYYVPGLVSKLVAAALPSADPPPPLALPPDLSRVERSVPHVQIVSVVPVAVTCGADGCPSPRALITLDVTAEAGSEAYDVHVLRDGNLAAEAPALIPAATADVAHWHRAMRIALDRTGHHTLRLELPLAASHNNAELSAYAFNGSRLKGPTARFTYRYAASPQPATPRAFVLAIGVGPSGADLDPLDWPPVDAVHVTRMIERGLGAAYRVVPLLMVSATTRWSTGEKPCRTSVLPPSRAAIQSVLAALAGTATHAHARVEIDLPCGVHGTQAGLPAPATPDDVVVVYISAHGIATGDEFSIVAEGGERIAAAELAQWMRALQSDHIVVVLDTCDSESAVASAGFRPGPLGDFTFGQLAFDKSMQILTASGANQDAIDSATIGGSLLVHSLSAQLDEGSGARMGELLRRAVGAVPPLFRQLGIAGQVQRPVLFDFRRGLDDVVLRGR